MPHSVALKIVVSKNHSGQKVGEQGLQPSQGLYVINFNS